MKIKMDSKVSSSRTNAESLLQKKQSLIQSGIIPATIPVPIPVANNTDKKFSRKTVLITGGSYGIGHAVAKAFIQEGADVVITDSGGLKKAKEAITINEDREKMLLIAGDISKPAHCKRIIEKTVMRFGGIDVLVNCSYFQLPKSQIEAIYSHHLLQTFGINVFSLFYLVQAALPEMQKNSCIINTASTIAFTGHSASLDYATSQGAVISFTRSLAFLLGERNIRVNAVASDLWNMRNNLSAIADCYLFLASTHANSINGQTIQTNGPILTIQ